MIQSPDFSGFGNAEVSIAPLMTSRKPSTMPDVAGKGMGEMMDKSLGSLPSDFDIFVSDPGDLFLILAGAGVRLFAEGMSENMLEERHGTTAHASVFGENEYGDNRGSVNSMIEQNE